MISAKSQMEREQREIQRRRRDDEARRVRFLNERVRTMGIDMTGIEKQIEEKKQRIQKEIDEDRAYLKQTVSFVDHIQQLSEQRQEEHARRALSVRQFQMNQDRKMSDTWDINDPFRQRKDQVPRMTDDQDVPVSSLQRFDGEDLGKQHRDASLRQQFVDSNSVIIRNKQLQKQQEKENDLAWREQTDKLVAMAEQVEKSHETRKVLALRTVMQDNQAKIAETQQQKKQALQKEKERESEEIAQMMRSPLLAEDFSSTFDEKTGKWLTDRFKGFGNTQLNEIMQTQMQQVKDKQTAAEQAKKEAELQQAQERETLRQAALAERALHRERSRRQAELSATHQRQLGEHQKQKEQLNQLYRNNISEDYWTQFQTTCR